MKKDRKELEDIKARVKVNSLFPTLVAIKHLNLSNLKITGKKFKKSFLNESSSMLLKFK